MFGICRGRVSPKGWSEAFRIYVSNISVARRMRLPIAAPDTV